MIMLKLQYKTFQGILDFFEYFGHLWLRLQWSVAVFNNHTFLQLYKSSDINTKSQQYLKALRRCGVVLCGTSNPWSHKYIYYRPSKWGRWNQYKYTFLWEYIMAHWDNIYAKSHLWNKHGTAKWGLGVVIAFCVDVCVCVWSVLWHFLGPVLGFKPAESWTVHQIRAILGVCTF